MDYKLLDKLLKENEIIITGEDGCLNGGFGSAVAEYIMDNGYINKLLRFGIPDKFVEHGKVNLLEKDLGLLPEQMAEKIEQFYLSKSYKVVG